MILHLELVVSDLIGLCIDISNNHTQESLEDNYVATVKEDISFDQIREKIISGCLELKKINEMILEHLKAKVFKPQLCL